MNKSELIAEIAKNASASKVAVEVILDEAICAITEALKKGYFHGAVAARHVDTIALHRRHLLRDCGCAKERYKRVVGEVTFHHAGREGDRRLGQNVAHNICRMADGSAGGQRRHQRQ